MTLRRPASAKCSPAQLEERHRAFLEAGWRLGDDGPHYVAWYVAAGFPGGAYLNKQTASIRVVVHPDAREKATRAADRSGATLAAAPYHNSNMDRFPKRVNGAKPIPYGFRVTCATPGQARAFLEALAA